MRFEKEKAKPYRIHRIEETRKSLSGNELVGGMNRLLVPYISNFIDTRGKVLICSRFGSVLQEQDKSWKLNQGQ